MTQFTENTLHYPVLNETGLYQEYMGNNLTEEFPSASLGRYRDLVGYKQGMEYLGGFVDLSQYADMPEIIRQIGLLSDITGNPEIAVDASSIDLTNADPLPNQNFIIIATVGENRYKLIKTLAAQIPQNYKFAEIYGSDGVEQYATKMFPFDTARTRTMIIASNKTPGIEPDYLGKMSTGDLEIVLPTYLAKIPLHGGIYWLARHVAQDTGDSKFGFNGPRMPRAFDPLFANFDIGQAFLPGEKITEIDTRTFV